MPLPDTKRAGVRFRVSGKCGAQGGQLFFNHGLAGMMQGIGHGLPQHRAKALPQAEYRLADRIGVQPRRCRCHFIIVVSPRIQKRAQCREEHGP